MEHLYIKIAFYLSVYRIQSKRFQYSLKNYKVLSYPLQFFFFRSQKKNVLVYPSN